MSRCANVIELTEWMLGFHLFVRVKILKINIHVQIEVSTNCFELL